MRRAAPPSLFCSQGSPLAEGLTIATPHTYRDDWRIVRTILTLYRIERPLLFFGGLGALLLLAALALVAPVLAECLRVGLAPRFPSLIVASSLVVVAVLCGFAGLILDTVVRGRREVRRLAYLALPGPGGRPLASALSSADVAHREA